MGLPPVKLPPVPSPMSLQPANSGLQMPSTQMINTDVSSFYELIVNGNIGKLNQEQRVTYYNKVCESLNLNPVTRPLAFIELQGKLTLYALKEAAAQLAKRDSVSCEILKVEIDRSCNMAFCDVRAKDPTGRFTDETAAVAWGDKLAGDNAANARMKLITKAKRRAILAHCGLGFLDEAELETIKDAREPVAPKTVPPVAPVEKPPAELQSAPAPAPAPVVHTSSVIPEPSPTVDAESFDYASPTDRQWLIAEVKSTFPGVNRDNIISLCGTFQKHVSKTTVRGILAARVEHEKKQKAAGKPHILGDE